MQLTMPLFEVTEPTSDIRTDVQKGRKVSYDVGQKIGGARKDEFQLKERFLTEKSVAALLDIEDLSNVLAAELVTREQLFDGFSLENEKERGVICKVAYFKKLVIQRIDKLPKDTAEAREAFVTASQKLLERLSALIDVEDLKAFVSHMNYLVRYETYSKDFFKHRMERLTKQLEDADAKDKEKYQNAIDLVFVQMDYASEASDCKFSSFGESFKNLFSKQQSLDSTLRRIDEIKSWDDLLTPKTVTKTNTPRKPVWERELPERPDRIGGMVSTVEKPEELMQTFNFRAVEFGHYVDDQKGHEHIFRSSEALMDLADILNLPNLTSLSLNGDLALAFGARGRGKALGHYESNYKVINFTKEKGSLGIFAHEWFHSLDNFLGNLSHDNKNGRAVYLSQADLLGPSIEPTIKNAMKDLLSAILEGESVDYFPNTNKEGDRWRVGSTTKSEYEKHNGDLYAIMKAYKEGTHRKQKSYYLEWARNDKEIEKTERKMAAEFKKHAQALAWYHQQLTGERVESIPYPSEHSQFFLNAVELDRGNKGKYWSSEVELVARAFEAWVQDQLESNGRRSDYLVYGTKDGIAYPTGEERENINAKMTELMSLVKASLIA